MKIKKLSYWQTRIFMDDGRTFTVSNPVLRDMRVEKRKLFIIKTVQLISSLTAVLSFLMLIGIVGRIDFLSEVKEVDTWSLLDYLKNFSFYMLTMALGAFVSYRTTDSAEYIESRVQCLEDMM